MFKSERKMFQCLHHHPLIGILILCIFIKPRGILLQEIKCDENKNQFNPYDDGTCLRGTKKLSGDDCCTGVRLCPPGYRQPDNLTGECEPCPKDHFSTDPENNVECIPCMDCGSLHRETKEKCNPTANTVCGDCIDGYYNGSQDNLMYTCLKCPEHDNTTPVYNNVSYWEGIPQCDVSKGQYLPTSGQCPPSTGIDYESQCCLLCETCYQGLKQAPHCLESCLPCEENHFSDQKNSVPCRECQDCEVFNRKTRIKCRQYADAVCGSCLEGYVEPQTSDEDTSISTRSCQKIVPTKDDINHDQYPQNSINMSLLNVVVLVLLTVIQIPLTLYLYTKCKKEDRIQNDYIQMERVHIHTLRDTAD